MTYLVLGAGMVGAVIATDLARDDHVVLADYSEAALERARQRAARLGVELETRQSDLSTAAKVQDVASGASVVVGALASHLGLDALRGVIGARKPYCDISFMPEDAIDLDAEARDAGVTAVVDCGVAPGMSNLLAGVGSRRIDAERIEIYVGGLPKARHLPFQYKAGFAPADVIEEYTRPSRIVEHGELVIRPALTEVEPLEFDGLGTLEACNTDGLRSLAATLDVPNMKEKTLRYPGHIALMYAFREAGLFGTDPIQVGDATVRPLDVTSKLLFPKWTFEPGEPDVTVMRVIVAGKRDGRDVVLTWSLHDEHDATTDTTSMARTTGFPAAIVARLLARGEINRPGVIPPEILGRETNVHETILNELESRGVRYSFDEHSPSLPL